MRHRSSGPVLLALAAALLVARPAAAQPRPFNCIGAEELEDDVFAVPFRAGSAQVTDAARSALAAAGERIGAEPDRNVCVLGHAQREGGQASSVRLAAERARAVSQALRSRFQVPEARLRAEARVAGFSRRTGNTEARSVSIVILPASVPVPERGPVRSPAAAARPAAPPAGTAPAAPAPASPPAASPAAPAAAPPSPAAPRAVPATPPAAAPPAAAPPTAAPPVAEPPAAAPPAAAPTLPPAAPAPVPPPAAAPAAPAEGPAAPPP
ncbi:OmpA family protein [Roseomonas sp. BN140053]|uniref:OmpA family protein n=1 Tax=Roseomonas sp. BN140053 TaxID=3391898 RepID=UPI0039EC0BFC